MHNRINFRIAWEHYPPSHNTYRIVVSNRASESSKISLHRVGIGCVISHKLARVLQIVVVQVLLEQNGVILSCVQHCLGLTRSHTTARTLLKVALAVKNTMIDQNYVNCLISSRHFEEITSRRGCRSNIRFSGREPTCRCVHSRRRHPEPG